jgi:hypothetical protein
MDPLRCPLNHFSDLITPVPISQSRAMEPTYFEVLFFKSGVSQNEHWRVIIELDDENTALLNTGMNPETRTRWFVAIAGVLDLLPMGLDTKWDKSGKVVGSTYAKSSLGERRSAVHAVPQTESLGDKGS